MPQNYEGQHRNHDGNRQPGGIEQNVKEQYVDDDRAEQSQPQRDKPARQQERAADDLQSSHHIKVVADEQRLGEVARRAARGRWLVEELQKNVQAKNDERQTQ